MAGAHATHFFEGHFGNLFGKFGETRGICESVLPETLQDGRRDCRIAILIA